MAKKVPASAPETQPDETIDKLTLELRRGVIVLACLSQLDEPSYGYELQQRLAARGMEIEQGTLYPLLRRLEEQGLLGEEWIVESSRPRKYYRLTDAGKRARAELREQWNEMSAVLDALLAPSSGG
ncbi:MAG TPA: PadR family transcriptional regulator [Gemmatimonadota bacterium]|nr:PadR family transcriptional regulator [Gemmatimonadota bacterium]